MRLRNLIISGLAVIALSNSLWSAQKLKIEPAWSHIEFSVKNFGINTVDGRFTSFAGEIIYDEADITKSSVTVNMSVASIDTGNKKRDAHLQTADFFEAAKYPELTFHSERIVKGANGYIMSGPLTIKGHSQDVELPFTFTVEKSQQGTSTLHAEASGKINRHDFGINYGSNFSVGKEVKILVHIQATP